MLRFLSLYCLVLLTGCSFRFASLYVDMGAAASVLPPPTANVQRIFIDRMGNVYPEMPLPRAAVRAGGSRIDSLFADSVALRRQLLTLYRVNEEDNEAATWQNLQQAIISKLANQINTSAVGAQFVTLLIHGIGNDINQDDIKLNRNPYFAYQKAEQKIDSLLLQKGKKTFFIEVYWDALHRVKTLDFVGVFAGARTNSYYAGLSLRNLVRGLQTDSLVILTHSLGAGVGCELLFDQTVSVKKEPLGQYLTQTYADTLYHATPPQQYVRLGMIVPAIPGKSTFAHYYQRTGHLAPVGNEKDRYAVWVGYNNKDRIITKHIIAQLQSPLLVRYVGSSTALGALRGENKRVAKLFARQYPQSAFTAIDFQNGGGNQSPQTTHYFSNYCDNQHFLELISALYNL